MNRIRFALVTASLCTLLLFSSGCAALLLLGIGGAGGYLIKKGEGEDRRSSAPEESTEPTHATNVQETNGREVAWSTGGTSR